MGFKKINRGVHGDYYVAVAGLTEKQAKQAQEITVTALEARGLHVMCRDSDDSDVTVVQNGKTWEVQVRAFLVDQFPPAKKLMGSPLLDPTQWKKLHELGRDKGGNGPKTSN